MTTFAIIFTVVIHTLGVPVMIWAVRGDEGLRGLFSWFPSDDEDGGGGSKKPEDPEPVAPTGGAPLPESEPAKRRLRDHGDRVANPQRQPRRRVRPQQPEPERAPTPSRPRR